MALHVVKARRDALTRLLRRNGYLPLSEVCLRLGVSPSTGRRDLAALARGRYIKRTYGGALVSYDRRFPSFRERQQQARGAKQRIARAAARLIKPGMTIFLDAGTTVYAIAEALAARPVPGVTAVTNSLPAAEVMAEAGGPAVHLVGGEFWARQSVLFGRQAQRCLGLWKFDLAFLGAEGMTAVGLWNSQADIVAYQRKAAARSRRALFCVDASKLGRLAPEFLVPWTRVGGLLTDAPAGILAAAGIPLGRDRLFLPGSASPGRDAP